MLVIPKLSKDKFACKRCPDCCFFRKEEEMPLIFYWEKEELEKIAEERGLKLSFKNFLVVETPQEEFVYIYRWIINGKCPFLNGVDCTIHNRKPLSCRMFPLVVEIPKNRVYLSLRCRWVREHIRELSPADLPYVFEEIEIAAKVIGMVNDFLRIAKENGWKIRTETT